MRNHGWFGYTFTGIEQTLPKNWFISLDYFGRTKSVSLQGKGSSYSDYGITVKKSFLNKRLNVSVYAGSLFNKYTRQDDVTKALISVRVPGRKPAVAASTSRLPTASVRSRRA